MSAGIFSTPRSVPGKLAPVLAGGAVIALALPVFAVAGWPLAGWALAAVLWAAAQAFAIARPSPWLAPVTSADRPASGFAAVTTGASGRARRQARPPRPTRS